MTLWPTFLARFRVLARFFTFLARVKFSAFSLPTVQKQHLKNTRLILSLPLLPAERVAPTFTALYAQTSGRVKLVCDYIDHQWIDDNTFFNPST